MEEDMVSISRKEYDDLWDGCWYGAYRSLEMYKEMRKTHRSLVKSGCARDTIRNIARCAWEKRVQYIRFRKAIGCIADFK